MNTTSNKLLVAVIVLQGLMLLGLWTSNGLPAAHAQVMDSGSQRQQMVEELKGVNAKLDRLIGILESGQVQVRLQAADEKDDRGTE